MNIEDKSNAGSGDQFDFKNVQGNINIKARLERVVQSVQIAPTLTVPERDNLVRLLSELHEAVKPVASQNPRGAERVLKQAETIADELKADKPDKGFLSVTADGLKKAAEAVAEIAPSVLGIASKVIAFLTALPQ